MNVPVDGVRAMLKTLSGDISMFPNLEDIDEITIRVDHAAVLREDPENRDTICREQSILRS